MSPGEPPPAGSGAPTTETLSTVPRLPLSLRIIGRSSVPGAIVVLAVAFAFVVLVPTLADAVAGSDEGGDDTVAAGGTLELTLADGWSVESQAAGVTTLVSGSATLTVTASVSGPGTADALLIDEIDRIASDPTANWVISDPLPYESPSGVGETFTAASETLSTQTWVVDNGSLDTVSTLLAPLETWATALPGAEQIVNSMVVTPAGESSPEPSQPVLP
jgi:hypothetical protein